MLPHSPSALRLLRVAVDVGVTFTFRAEVHVVGSFKAITLAENLCQPVFSPHISWDPYLFGGSVILLISAYWRSVVKTAATEEFSLAVIFKTMGPALRRVSIAENVSEGS